MKVLSLNGVDKCNL